MAVDTTMNAVRTQHIQQVKGQENGSKAGKIGGGNDSPFAQGSDNLDASIKENGGMMYRSGSVSHKTQEGSTTPNAGEPSAAQISSAKGQTSAGKAQLGSAKSTMSAQKGATSSYDASMQDKNNQIANNESIISGKTSEMLNSGKILQSNTAHQQQIAAWLENAGPTIDQMGAEIDALTEEALGTIPQELGVSAETLDEAMAQLSEMIDEEKMTELQEAQERSAEIDEQLQTMDPEDPEYDSLVSEQEGLQTTLQDPDNAKMMLASETLAGLADYSDAIGEIQTAMADYSAQIDAKQSELEQTEEVTTSESKNITSAKKTVNTTASNTTDLQKEADEESDSFMEGYETTMTVADITNTVGTVCKTVAVPLMPYPPTAAAGQVLNNVGIGLGIAGGATETVANIAAGVHTGDMSYVAAAVTSAANTAASAVSSIETGQAMAAKSAQIAKAAGASGSNAKAAISNYLKSDAGKAIKKEITKDTIKAMGDLGTQVGNTANKIKSREEAKKQKEAQKANA